MKTIENKTTSISNGDEVNKKFLTSGDLLKIIINTVPQGGLTVEEMKKRLRLIESLDKANETTSSISLEDADFDLLKTQTIDYKWGALHKDIIDLVDSINSIK